MINQITVKFKKNCLLNNNLSQGKGSWEYRYFLQQNAVEIQNKMIMEQEQKTKINCHIDEQMEGWSYLNVCLSREQKWISTFYKNIQQNLKNSKMGLTLKFLIRTLRTVLF